jgi:anthranilate phosphoribosyltransferase
MTSLFNGTASGPVLDFVLLNSAALLFVSGKAASLKDGVNLARQSISSGSALKELERFALASRS